MCGLRAQFAYIRRGLIHQHQASCGAVNLTIRGQDQNYASLLFSSSAPIQSRHGRCQQSLARHQYQLRDLFQQYKCTFVQAWPLSHLYPSVLKNFVSLLPLCSSVAAHALLVPTLGPVFSALQIRWGWCGQPVQNNLSGHRQSTSSVLTI